MRGGHQAGEIVLRHPLAQRAVRRFVRLERDRRRKAHQFQFVCILHHPAAGGDRRGAHRGDAGGRLADAIAEDEVDAFLDPQPPRRDAAVAQPLRDALVRALVLLPGSNVGGAGERTEGDLFARAVLFESRTHEEGFSFGRDHARKEPLAAAPADVGEVLQRRSLAEHNGVDPLFRHQPARLLDARPALVGGDRPHLRPHRGEGADRGRLIILLLGVDWCGMQQGGGGAGAVEELAS